MMHLLATMFLLCMGVLAKIVVGEASLSPLNQMAVLASICIIGLLGFFRPPAWTAGHHFPNPHFEQRLLPRTS